MTTLMAKKLSAGIGGSGKGKGPRPGGAVAPTIHAPFGPSGAPRSGTGFPQKSNTVSGGKPTAGLAQQFKVGGSGRKGK